MHSLGYMGICIWWKMAQMPAQMDTCDITVCVYVVLSPICLWYFLQQNWNTLIFLQFVSWFIKCLFIFFAFAMELKLARPFSCLNKRNFSVNNISSHKCIFVLLLMSEQNEGWYLWGEGGGEWDNLFHKTNRGSTNLWVFCIYSILTFSARAWWV